MAESNEINNTIYDAVSNALENKINNCNTLLPSTTGKSTYDLAVDYGYIGTEREWLSSIANDTTVVSNLYADAQSFSDFMSKSSAVSVPRRLAPPIHTLNYYLDYFNGLEALYSQESGTVTVNGVEIKTVRQGMNDAVDDVLLGEYQEGIRSDLNAQKLDTGITATAKSGGVERTQAEKNNDSVSAQDYGAIGDGTLHKLSERFNTLGAAQIAYSSISSRIVSLEQSIDWCAIQCASFNNSKVHLTKPVYVLNDALEIDHGKEVVGNGCDTWDMASTTGKPNSMQRGTTLLFVDTPFKTYNVFGVTRNSLTGGVLTNPSPLETEFSTYELSDFTNKDASGTTAATLKDLKCAVVLYEAHNSALRDVRILKSYNGIDGYNDANMTGMGDDYDIGLLILNTSFADISNVQSVGYWKMFGGVQVNSENKSVGLSKMGEGVMNVYTKCFFQGLTGFGFRANDEHKVLTATGTTFTIPYDNSNLVVAGDTLTNGTDYPVTETAVIGDTLSITTSGALPSVGATLRHVRYNFGVAGVTMRDSIITGLFHKSRRSAKDTGFSKNSCALELSGGVLRDIDFDNVHVFDTEVLVFANNVDDVSFKGSYFEPQGVVSIGGVWQPSGSRFIANGVVGDSSAKYPIEGVKNLTLDSTTEVSPHVDLYPYNRLRPARFTDSGFFKPHSAIVDASGSQTVNRFPVSRSETVIMTTGLYDNQRKIRMVDRSFNNLVQVYESGSVSIGNTSSDVSKLYLYTSAATPASTTHDIVVDAPIAGSQYRSRSGGRWYRQYADATGFRLSYSSGQSSTYSSNAFYFNPDASTPELAVNGIVRPVGDNLYSLGAIGSRWSTVYASTGTISTSDERLKTKFDSVSSAEKRAALKIKESIGRYQFTDAVDSKGDKARYHFGVGAQTVGKILQEEGLNPEQYAFYCYDEWKATEEIEAGNRYGIRYEELVMFILAAT